MSRPPTEAQEVVVTELDFENTIKTELKYKTSQNNVPRFRHIREILEALETPKTALEIAQRTRKYPSNVHRTLHALQDAGWVARMGIRRVGHNKPARLWRRCARLVFEDEFLAQNP